MATNAIFRDTVVLPDARTLRILVYPDGSVRIRLSGCPYVVSECYLTGKPEDAAIIKLSRK
jgi:hypothetical protein